MRWVFLGRSEELVGDHHSKCTMTDGKTHEATETMLNPIRGFSLLQSAAFICHFLRVGAVGAVGEFDAALQWRVTLFWDALKNWSVTIILSVR